MLKILGSFFVLSGCIYFGFLCGENLRHRFNELTEIHRCINQLKNELCYSYLAMPQILEKIALKSKFPINDVFYNVSNVLNNNEVNSIYEGFNITLQENKSLNLKKEDIDILLDLAKSLGELDVDSQKRMIDLALYDLKQQCDVAKIEMRKNIKMYRYLGFSIGATIVIIFI